VTSTLDPVVLALPFRGTWLARNSPARRVPSHGTHLFATTYALDFIAVRGRRTATTQDWRTLVATEPVDRFFAFGQPILAPAAGRVVSVHDGETDHAARRSQLTLVPYALTTSAVVWSVTAAAGPMSRTVRMGRGPFGLACRRYGVGMLEILGDWLFSLVFEVLTHGVVVAALWCRDMAGYGLQWCRRLLHRG
jgi:hypothetical protein